MISPTLDKTPPPLVVALWWGIDEKVKYASYLEVQQSYTQGDSDFVPFLLHLWMLHDDIYW